MNDTIKKVLQMQREKMAMIYGELSVRKLGNNVFLGGYGAKAIASATVGYSIDLVLERLHKQGIEI